MTTSRQDETNHSHQTLLVYLYYRIALSGVLLLMFVVDIAPNTLGAKSDALYFCVSIAYFVFAFLSPFIFPAKSLRHSIRRINFLLTIDVLAQLALIHASNGMDSGLGYLLIITTAMINIFARGQLAYTYAALMSIALILDNLYLHQYSNELPRVMFSCGTLGVLIFSTTIALQYLIEKIRKTTAEAERQYRHARNLQEIAQNIVTRMQTGVIVVDNELRIELMNTSAKQMLDIPIDSLVYGDYLANYRELAPVLKRWDEIIQSKQATVLRVRAGFEIRVNVAHLETGDIPKNIFYLEDYSSIKQYAQQLKLASLGRLAARIAHEIRNPLGALSHASQLLAESHAIEATDKRMTEIIQSNCGRVNEIVENTLALSRRKEPQLELIDLAEWLPRYIDEAHYQQKDNIHLNIENASLLTRFDPTHLQQILANLIDNGLRYSGEINTVPWLELKVAMQSSDAKPYLEVKDNGKGIPQEKVPEIFEPFYTTSEKGSGLGLFISRELAEINHATLHYKRSADGLSCFRIDFSHHQRMR